jgi:hypothetical protein
VFALAGALVAGPLAAAIGVRVTEFAATALIAAVSALCLIPRDIRAADGRDPLPASAPDAITAEPLPAVPG